ncbi:hypothetical protein BV133_853 [Blastochloris viridis]|uniref:Uncharacterized protein n=1 Tax=Blastochloris viridis TaxID=1079 RepID=A0A182CYX9_BLAVI|nr:hypothetical protein BV133_853 [Blastochloris viridis]
MRRRCRPGRREAQTRGRQHKTVSRRIANSPNDPGSRV